MIKIATIALLATMVFGCTKKPAGRSAGPEIWIPIFYPSIHQLEEKAKWPRLSEYKVEQIDLEIRVWMGFGLGPLEGIRIKKMGDQWSAEYAREEMGNWTSEFRDVVPRSDWPSFWKSIKELGIVDLPDSSKLKNENMVLDGITYVVEVRRSEAYRTYRYGNPDHQEWPEAKKISKIVKILRKELLEQT